MRMTLTLFMKSSLLVFAAFNAMAASGEVFMPQMPGAQSDPAFTEQLPENLTIKPQSPRHVETKMRPPENQARSPFPSVGPGTTVLLQLPLQAMSFPSVGTGTVARQ